MNDASLPVVIVGGGFSGAMLAARLAERGQASILIERGDAFGPGVAYSTTNDAHRLNVRAGRMGAVADRPDDFIDWLAAHHPDQADPDGFAPRRLYGLYVRDRLTTTETAHPGLIRRLSGAVIAVEGRSAILSTGERVEGRAVVLATGNPAPRTTPTGEDGRIIANPWTPDALTPIQPGDDILILGAGLTMVDVLLTLSSQGWRGQATAVSRRGLTPRAHGEHHDAPVALPPDTEGLTVHIWAAERAAASARKTA